MANPKWEDTQPIQESAPKWDDTIPLVSNVAQEAPISGVASLTSGLANGASAGFAPAISSLGKTAMDAITGISGPLAGGSLDDLVDEYRKNRDNLKEEFAKAARAHPVISGAGNLVGGGASLAALGPSAATTGGLLATGAVNGLGHSNADLTRAISDPSQIKEAAKDAAFGAGTNLVVGKALGKVMNALTPDALTETAETAAVKSLNPIKSQMKALQTADNVTGPDSLGRTLLDTPGVMSPFASLAEKQAAMQGLEESSGKAIGNTIDLLDQGGYQAPSPGDLAKSIQENAAPLENLKTAQPTFKALQDVGEDIKTLGNAPPADGELPGGFRQVQNLKNFVKDQVEKAGGWKTPNPSEKNLALRDVYKMIGDKLESSTESAAIESGDKDLLTNYLKAKSNYGNSKDASTILNGSVAAEAANNKIGLTSTIVGSGELAAGNPVKAAATMGLWQGAKTYGNNITAVSADKLAQVLKAAPESFGQFAGVLKSASERGAVGLGATDYILSQTNPDYRAKKKEALGEERPNE